ncbi:MAG: hypothetical protein JW751_03230 [Polyangiaceae bacterium]|nr:hypothetical protein [Polyangiaceae bacterium]
MANARRLWQPPVARSTGDRPALAALAAERDPHRSSRDADTIPREHRETRGEGARDDDEADRVIDEACRAQESVWQILLGRSREDERLPRLDRGSQCGCVRDEHAAPRVGVADPLETPLSWHPSVVLEQRCRVGVEREVVQRADEPLPDERIRQREDRDLLKPRAMDPQKVLPLLSAT